MTQETRELQWRCHPGGARMTRAQLLATPGAEVVDEYKIDHGLTTVRIVRTPDGRHWANDSIFPSWDDRSCHEMFLERPQTMRQIVREPWYQEPEFNLAANLRLIHDQAHQIPYTLWFARLDDLRRRACAQLCEAADACWHACLNAQQVNDDLPAAEYMQALARTYGGAMRQVREMSLGQLADYARSQIALAPLSYDYWVTHFHPAGRYAWPMRAPGMESIFGQLDAWVAVLALADAGRALPYRAQIAAGYIPTDEPQEVRRDVAI